MADKPATLVAIKTYFETSDRMGDGKLFKNAVDFGSQWKELTPEDQAQLRAGIGNGALTY